MKTIIPLAIAIIAVCLLAGCGSPGICSREPSNAADQNNSTCEQTGGANAVQEQMAAIRTEQVLDKLQSAAIQ